MIHQHQADAKLVYKSDIKSSKSQIGVDESDPLMFIAKIIYIHLLKILLENVEKNIDLFTFRIVLKRY